MIPLLLTAVVLAAVPMAGLAQTCPTRADLERGVTLTRDDPFFSVAFTETADGLAEARIQERGGEVSRPDTTYAHALAVSSRRSQTGRLSVAYDSDPAVLDALPSLRSWTSGVTVTDGDTPIVTGLYTATMTGLGQAVIGDCTYAVWRVRDELTLDTGTTIAFEKSYAPELGLVVGSIQLDAAGQPTGSVFFDAIAAE